MLDFIGTQKKRKWDRQILLIYQFYGQSPTHRQILSELISVTRHMIGHLLL